ncbi:hypothetical protein ZOSMA_103G00360 [Zostera marina]|uniref:BFN domain-containing protein n=1 Tax=Zostera marina TaxID=29655 RepID=A0A0K9Q6A4_ZOSMR|nr:hypothetical protein ZOSMA_103G00360 [Zostera marina]
MLRLQSTPCVPSSTTSLCHSHNYDSASSVIRIHSVRFPVTRFWWSKRARGRYVFENKWRFLCRSSQGNSSAGCHGDSSQEWNNDDRFLQATLLVTETIRHYNLRKRGFVDESKWHSSGWKHPLSVSTKGSKSDITPLSHGFLRRFHSPTIFLKVACKDNLILPIVVGEFAIERLMHTLTDNKLEESPNQFQFIKNLVSVLGYQVKKVWITKRVFNTYYAQIFLGKTAQMENISIDSRPSDAIHLANGFKAPIYVSKEIIFKDAIRIVCGAQRKEASKIVYDVLLDSAIEGPDLLMEELDLVRKLNTAIIEERYKDAAIWRDKLKEIRMP